MIVQGRDDDHDLSLLDEEPHCLALCLCGSWKRVSCSWCREDGGLLVQVDPELFGSASWAMGTGRKIVLYSSCLVAMSGFSKCIVGGAVPLSRRPWGPHGRDR